jgi:SAM-dependent methyltransferase
VGNDAEKIVAKFYNEGGWEVTNGVTTDAEKFEDLREVARDYVSKCRLRVLRHVPTQGQYLLDMASGPIQYDEYLEYSRNFAKRFCVDLSSSALAQARAKIGDHGVFLHGSFFDLEFKKDFFDCAISLHTIYHMESSLQEAAVRKLIDITKPGHPIIIVYSNPDTFIAVLRSALRRSVGRQESPGRRTERTAGDLYFFPHAVGWWQRFEDVANVRMYPWRSFGTPAQKAIFRNNFIGKWMFTLLFALEESFPVFFVRHFQYPMIVLTKK